MDERESGMDTVIWDKVQDTQIPGARVIFTDKEMARLGGAQNGMFTEEELDDTIADLIADPDEDYEDPVDFADDPDDSE